jgi:hypothetical protein
MFDQFREIWLWDYEFGSEPGERQVPVCLVAHELRSGRKLRLWRDEFGATPPFSTGPDALWVSYLASAEIRCNQALGWPTPARVLDLFVEFRCLTNGLELQAGSSLRGALIHYGLDAMAADDKKAMQHLALDLGRTGRAPQGSERNDLLDYCESDVDALARLLPTMAPKIDLPRAIVRGRYMKAVAKIEDAGVPIDVAMLARLRAHWEEIKTRLIVEINRNYRIWENGSFKERRFEEWLIIHDIPWPRLESGELDKEDDTFREMAKAYPAVAPIAELRSTLSKLRLNDLAVGHDGRNRTLLSVFRAVTSRNQPSNSKFVFGPATWIRGLIQPPPGHAVVYVDWSQQEFGIAAALSDDQVMQAAYTSGDPYLAFAKLAGAVPPDATKESHESTRDLYKAAVLGIGYGMGEHALARRVGRSQFQARGLLAAHKQAFRRFWEWSEAAVNCAVLKGQIHTRGGWVARVGPEFNPRQLQNFPMQGNGADMLRLACCFATERGVEVCAPVHDALLICAPIDRIEHDVAVTRTAMARASRVVLDGFELRTDYEPKKIIRWPNRYTDKRGKVMWDTVTKLLDEIEGKAA